MKIKYGVFGPFATNTYILYNEKTLEGVVVDPSFSPEQYIRAIEADHLDVKSIFLTHAHVDHMAGMNALRKAFPKAELYMNIGDKDYLKDSRKNLSFQFTSPLYVDDPDHWVKGGDHIETIGEDFLVLDTPGHTPGGISFYDAKEGVVFTGDSLFQGSIGRTDFPGGNLDQLLSNIRTHLFTLPEDTTVLSGHGDPTTIGAEKRMNPFFHGGFR